MDAGNVSDPPLVGATEAPDVYIEGYQGTMVYNGVVKVNAYVLAMNPASEQTSRKVVARLTMPLASMISIHDAFGKLIEDLEKDGVITRKTGVQDAGE